jgi:hypothetical protein
LNFKGDFLLASEEYFHGHPGAEIFHWDWQAGTGQLGRRGDFNGEFEAVIKLNGEEHLLGIEFHELARAAVNRLVLSRQERDCMLSTEDEEEQQEREHETEKAVAENGFQDSVIVRDHQKLRNAMECELRTSRFWSTRGDSGFPKTDSARYVLGQYKV